MFLGIALPPCPSMLTCCTYLFLWKALENCLCRQITFLLHRPWLVDDRVVLGTVSWVTMITTAFFTCDYEPRHGPQA